MLEGCVLVGARLPAILHPGELVFLSQLVVACGSIHFVPDARPG